MGDHISERVRSDDVVSTSQPSQDAIFSSADRIAIPSATLEGLRSCLCAGKGRVSRDEIRGAIAPVCEMAKRTQVMPEQLLVTLKELCQTMPEYGRMRGTRERDAFIEAVVTTAIEEYYRR